MNLTERLDKFEMSKKNEGYEIVGQYTEFIKDVENKIINDLSRGFTSFIIYWEGKVDYNHINIVVKHINSLDKRINFRKSDEAIVGDYKK